jgi:hypothetical protein
VRRSCTSAFIYVGCRKEGENLNRRLAQQTAILACVLTIAFAYEAQAQDQTSTASLSTASSAQAKPKTKPDAAEAEAGTSEGTEALQKATQNPVASLISVPVQNNNNFGMNPGYRNQDVLNIQPGYRSASPKTGTCWFVGLRPLFINRFPISRQRRRRASTALETWCLHSSFHQRSPGS